MLPLHLVQLVAGLVALAAAATPHRSRSQRSPGRILCGFQSSAHRPAVQQQVRRSVETLDPINIDVYVHVIHEGRGSPSYLSNQTVHDQIDTLNYLFGPGHIGFTLKRAYWTHDAELSRGVNAVHWRIGHHKGDSRVLNIYYGHAPNRVDKGEGSNPPERKPSWLELSEDFVSMPVFYLHPVNITLQNATAELPTRKYVIAHEVGHWLGLDHTWGPKEGQCSKDGNGDGIDDTPFHTGPSDCIPDHNMDTCPHDAGLDPVGNPMNYIFDHCITNNGNKTETGFTPGQFSFMRDQWRDHRLKYAFFPTTELTPAQLDDELHPQEPQDKGGAKPWYPTPANEGLAFARCTSATRGATPVETREAYCGTSFFCYAQKNSGECEFQREEGSH